MFDTLLITFDYIATSLALQILCVSTVLIIVSCALLAWKRTAKVSYLENVPLKRLEKEHPYMPTSQSILAAMASILCMLLVLANLLPKLPPNSPSALYAVIGSFVLIGTVIVLGDLYSRGWRLRSSAISLGTAVGVGASSAFSALLGGDTPQWQLVLLAAVAALFVLAQLRARGHALRTWPWDVYVFFGLSLFLWASVFLLLP